MISAFAKRFLVDRRVVEVHSEVSGSDVWHCRHEGAGVNVGVALGTGADDSRLRYDIMGIIGIIRL